VSATAPSPDTVGVAVELARQTALLHALLADERAELVELAVHDGPHPEMVLDQFPVAGSKRIIARRVGNGFASLSVPTSGVLALPANTSRLGVQLSNSGTAAIILYLSDQQRAGIPCVYLAAGASWDGRFGSVCWSGNVYAVAQTGASTLCGGEF
jgi:hypothetical protein